MLSVNFIDQFLRVPETPCRFPASLNITVTLPLYERMKLPLALLRVNDPDKFLFVSIVDNGWLWFILRFAGSRRCTAVDHGEVDNVMLPEYIRKVRLVNILIDDLTYRVSSCPFAIRVL